jgi:ABC-type dipeptide/oligopeptide/nickel transport system permease subunit
MTSWGVLIQDGAGVMDASPWILLFPAGMLSVTCTAPTISATACAMRSIRKIVEVATDESIESK